MEGTWKLILTSNAKFDGDGTYGHARSYNQVISVLRYGGSISLGPINPSAMVGELVEFSGTLRLDGGSPEGAVVYIKDEDPLSGDELLAVAYVDGSGRFSAHWLADYTDVDDTVDIYAVFEGDEDLARLTTCDAGPTMPIGGTCPNTIPLTVHGTFLPPAAPDGGGSGKRIHRVALRHELIFQSQSGHSSKPRLLREGQESHSVGPRKESCCGRQPWRTGMVEAGMLISMLSIRAIAMKANRTW